MAACLEGGWPANNNMQTERCAVLRSSATCLWLSCAPLCSNWPQPLFQLTKPSTLYSLYYTRLTPDSSCLLTNNVQSQSSDLFRLHCKISRLFRNRSHFMLNLHMCCKKGTVVRGRAMLQLFCFIYWLHGESSTNSAWWAILQCKNKDHESVSRGLSSGFWLGIWSWD